MPRQSGEHRGHGQSSKTPIVVAQRLARRSHRAWRPREATASGVSIFGDYEILQPFDQLGRAVYRSTPAELEANLVARVDGVTVKTGKLLGLEARGWRKGEPQDGGWVWDMIKPLPGNLRAVLDIAALPVRYVIGLGEPQQTALEQLRLVSMGARVHADGDLRRAHVYLADPDAGTVLVLEAQWQSDGTADADDVQAIARRTVAPGIGLGAFAHGQVVTRAAKRSANLSLQLGTRKGTTALLPGIGDRTALPASLFVRDYAALVQRLQRRPAGGVAAACARRGHRRARGRSDLACRVRPGDADTACAGP